MLLWCLLEKIFLIFGFEKRDIFNKFPFLHKAFHGISGKGLPYFYQETSSLIINQTNQRTNMCLPY